MSIDDRLPEGTVVITQISELSPQSQEIIRHFGWTLEDFINMYHKAAVFGRRYERGRDGLLIPNNNGRSYKVEDPTAVLEDKAKKGENGITHGILPQYMGALAVRYLEPLDKKNNVSIKGTADEAWGFFPHPKSKMDQKMSELFANGYMNLALSTPQ